MGKCTNAFAVIVLVVALLSGLILKVIVDAGEFKTLVPHGGDRCKLVGEDKVLGVEDIALDHSEGIAYFGSSTRSYLHPDSGWKSGLESVARGSFWAYHLPRDGEHGVLKQLTLENFNHEDINPHGVSFRAFADGKKFLFAVNHRKDGEVVEAFEVVKDGEVLRHVWSAIEPVGMRWINDVHAVSEDSFYVTNWMYYNQDEKKMHMFEVLTHRPWTFVSFCQVRSTDDGHQTQCTRVADGLVMANGLIGNKDDTQIYVVETLGHSVKVYDRNANDSLSLVQSVHTGSGCDNIHLDPESGCLFSGCHPKGLTFVKHSADPHNIPSPSQALMFDPKLSNSPVEVLLTDGVSLSGSSTVVIDRDSSVMLVGGVFSKGFLQCDMPAIDLESCSMPHKNVMFS